MELIEIVNRFGVNNVSEISNVIGGHINNTFLVKSRDGQYVLQKLNSEVFRNPEAIMRNISKLERIFENTEGSGVKIPHFLRSEEECNFIEADGEIYRMYNFAEPVHGIQDRFHKMGFSFGTFIKLLNGKNIRLDTSIENFHSYSSYLSSLTAADANSAFRKIDRIVMRRLSSLKETLEQVFTVDFPKRNIHNDAKVGNIVFGKICTVIDLDTVMEGYAAIDYGDMIRSVCTADRLDFVAVRDITNGFADALKGILTDDEIYSLYYGILYVTGELAVRYLIDYIRKDKYFKEKTSAQCLRRANELLRQLNTFISSGDEITAIIYKAFKKQ